MLYRVHLAMSWILVIQFSPFRLNCCCQWLLNDWIFQCCDYLWTWCRLFHKRTVHTIFDIYVFIIAIRFSSNEITLSVYVDKLHDTGITQTYGIILYVWKQSFSKMSENQGLFYMFGNNHFTKCLRTKDYFVSVKWVFKTRMFSL
jgi:hypothetical protein